MKKLIEGIKYDARFIRDHQLQPDWYKILKAILLPVLMAAYYLLFGPWKTLAFFGIFFGLSTVLHLVYRHYTRRFTTSWLDFFIEEVEGVSKPARIGKYYYPAVIMNGLIAFLISQLLVS